MLYSPKKRINEERDYILPTNNAASQERQDTFIKK